MGLKVKFTMFRIFQQIYPAPLLVRKQSRECCAYMYRVMKFVGWIPPKKQGIKRNVYLLWMCLVFGLSTLYLPIGLILSIFMDFKNLTHREFYGVLQIAFNTVGASIKTIILLIFLTRLQQTKSLLDKLNERLQSDSDQYKIHKAVASCNYVFLVYSIVFFVYTVTVIMSGMVNGQPPWMVYNPFFDWRNEAINFWKQSILEYIIAGGAVIIVLITDSYNIVLVMIFRAHLEVLKQHIRNLRTDTLKTEEENYKELIGYIKDHKLILHCCAIMRPVFSRTILVQFLLVGIVLGINLINISYFTDIVQMVSSIVNLTGNLLESFPFCYLCDLLSEDCADLAKLLAQSNWIGAEPKYKSTLRIFMHNVQMPIIFNAGGMFPISLNTNIKLAKLAFSVMTLVQEISMDEDESDLN